MRVPVKSVNSLTKECRCCAGSGQEINHYAVGLEMFKLRKAAGISQAGIAELLGFSGAYLSDLEHGKRNWSQPLIDKYRKLCKTHENKTTPR